MSTNNAYHLSEEWVKINESTGYLHNTSQQNIEYIVVPVGVEPPKNGGKVIMPRNFYHFELPDSKEMYVRVFRKMPSGYIPTAVVNSEADLFRQEDNPLEGSTNSLTIGLSTWRQTAWYPLEWCVIAENALWQCIKAHEPSEIFRDDVANGCWKCLTLEGVGITAISIGNTGKMTVTYSDGTQDELTIVAGNALTATTADRALADGNGNNIIQTYVTKTEVTNALSNYTTTADMQDAIDNAVSEGTGSGSGIGEAVSDIESAVSEAQTTLTNLGNNVFVSASKLNDTTIRLTKGNGTNTDITLGASTYATASDLQEIAEGIASSVTGDMEHITDVTTNLFSEITGNVGTAYTVPYEAMFIEMPEEKVYYEAVGQNGRKEYRIVPTVNGEEITSSLVHKGDVISYKVVTTTYNDGGVAPNQSTTPVDPATITYKLIAMPFMSSIDTALSDTSTNPVQNKAIALALAALAARVSALESLHRSSSGGGGFEPGCGG